MASWDEGVDVSSERRFFLTLTVKNEAPNIVEWVAYHRMIGFTDIVVYQNDSVDGTQKLLRTMAKHGYIQYFKNESKYGAPQNRAYRRASRLDEFKTADWAMTLDGDEFLVIHEGEGRVADLVDALPPEANCATIHWKFFGSSGHANTPDGLVSEEFTRAEPREKIGYRGAGFKSIFRPSVFLRPGIHKPRVPADGAVPVYCNGSGDLLGDVEDIGWFSRDRSLRKLAQVNHYAIRDPQQFILKSARGRTANHGRAVDKKYWDECNANDEEDLALSSKSGEIREVMAEMDRKTRGRLTLLAQEGRRINQELFASLMEDPYYRQVYEEICADGKGRDRAAA